MANKLFVGSLAFSVSDDELAQFFASAGKVISAKVILDHENGRSKGFGFVEMSSDAEAQTAIETLNGKELNGRPINVSLARPREARPSGSFDGNR